MVWRFPPERAGRAPHASRHSNNAEVVAVRLTLVGDVAAGSGADAGVAPAFVAETESTRVVLEQAPIMAAMPTLPATPNSWRRLTTAGDSWGRPGAGSHTALTIRACSGSAGCVSLSSLDAVKIRKQNRR